MKPSLAVILIITVCLAGFSDSEIFTYNGFQSAANFNIDGVASITGNGLLLLTNSTVTATGHALYPDPIKFKDSQNGSAFSFSTTFVFAIRSDFGDLSAHGLAFVIAARENLPGGASNEFLGFTTNTTAGNATNHVFAVEVDTIQNADTADINDNHVGIDINTAVSVASQPAAYYHDGAFRNVSLVTGGPTRVWVDYNGAINQITVTIAPAEVTVKPEIPLLNLTYDLSPVFQQEMYVGFSSTTGPDASKHYILGWSFATNGDTAQNLNLSELPKLPRIGPKKVNRFLTIGVPLISLFAILSVLFSVLYYLRRKMKFAEVLEDWEIDYGPQRFKYKDLYTATRGFRDSELLGAGGFGRVYKGVIAATKTQIAVKRISHQSKQGMREFVAEIASIGRMSHRNLVPLLGYCRRKNELILVYENMPNGSLDKFLHRSPENSDHFLNWSQRFQIIKGVASGMFYLHEGWEQVVVHRDIKASNVLLDGEMNARVGDFGLAKLYDHGSDPQTTHVVGTVGYLAPEHYRTGRATTNTDVYAFGAFLLEVVCGKRPIEQRPESEDLILVDWVFSVWSEGRILDAVDRNLRDDDYVKEEAEMVLKLGLMCSNSVPEARPSMQMVMLYLDGSMELPDLSAIGITEDGIGFAQIGGFDNVKVFSSSSSEGNASISSWFSNSADSVLSGGR